jgi:ubiquinone/menaquinone biosynthesis C-methylase UbiE
MTIKIDTGTQLRTLYETQGGVGEIFSDKVADYQASRPDYPAQLFKMLGIHAKLDPGALVADIGAGTGLLTRGLLLQGHNVVAVEPNTSMRIAADLSLLQFPGYRSVDGTAESIPLEDSSVDLITAAQAFHWFEIDSAKVECLRVLRPNGQVALIWNDRVKSEPLHIALDEIFSKYGAAKREALVAHEKRDDVPKFFGVTVPVEFSFPHEHQLEETGLLSLAFSRSYMPDRDSPSGRDASHHIRQIVHRLATEGILSVRYTTVVMIGRPQ